ncbi:hypothetical protein CROQUDRAFT_657348 [Cronartium quercuum f. sp. fusiforme G11]|uniref:DUF7904 domain-containing protein n=1 Tax=Cronartium quercuum f. sp. fusiforme G11 TaxID=708437 RepID=A0A9P6TBQ9_9BASI|nr:hypothetical protein CROQUDRAFT_657348 [Cronartium quercuum f. sp. fusiforme G11]
MVDLDLTTRLKREKSEFDSHSPPLPLHTHSHSRSQSAANQYTHQHHRTNSAAENVFEDSYQHWVSRVRATRESIDQADQVEHQKLRKEILQARQARRSRHLSMSDSNTLIDQPHSQTISNSNLTQAFESMSDHVQPQRSLANQNHSIQYSSKFESVQPNKPVALAHFMGARKDIHGPVLTRPRVDEKEVRPEGWELAERRAEILSKHSGSRPNPLASLIAPQPLPGMVSHEKLIDSNPISSQSVTLDPISTTTPNNDRLKQRSLPVPPSSINPPPAFLKPKSLADRLAQLGVVNDLKPHLSSPAVHHPSVSLGTSPVCEKFPDRQRSFAPVQIDQSSSDINGRDKLTKPTPPHHTVTKSKSTYNLKSTTVLEEVELNKTHRPTSAVFSATRLGPPSSTSHNPVQPDLTVSNHRPPLTNRSNSAQTVPVITGHKSSKSQNYHVTPQVTDDQPVSSAGLSASNKVLTASLSRLAGSNIVAQRLQWSKQKEHTGSKVDEFGTPAKSLFQPATASAAPIPDPINHSMSVPKRLSMFDRPIQARDVSPLKSNTGSRFQHSKTKSVSSDFPPTPTSPSVKNINQYNKSNRDSSDGDDQLQSESHDLKRNKKDFPMLKTPASPQKSHPKTPTSLARPALYGQPSDSSPPLKHLTKHRPRGPQKSAGSRTKSPAQTHRPLPSPSPSQLEQASTTVPSIPSFSPFVKKGTSELTAVWENQHQKNSLDFKPSGGTRPLPTPPALTPKGGIRVALPGLTETNSSSNRPLPLPPTYSSASSVPSTLKTFSSKPSSFIATSTEPKKAKKPTIITKPTKKTAPLDPKTIDKACRRPSDLLPITKLELFQLHKTPDEQDFSTTFVEPEDSNTFYADERLLIFCTLTDGKHILMMWKGKMVERAEEEEVGRLLKKYGIEHRSRLVNIQQGYEPAELVEALGGNLVIRLGKRFELDQPQSTVFSVRSYRAGRLLVIEESVLSAPSVREALCAGFCALVKVFDRQKEKINLFQWNGRHCDRLERQQCALVAQQIIKESAGFQPKLAEFDEGAESDEFRSLFGEEDFATSYHWRFKSALDFSPLLISTSTLSPIDSLCPKAITILHTGLEVFVLVPPSQRSDRAGLARAIELTNQLSSTSSSKILPVHCLVFPTLLPVDLRASVRFSYDLNRLNQPFGIPQKMNMWSLDEARLALEGGEVEVLDLEFLPLGIGPEDVVGGET